VTAADREVDRQLELMRAGSDVFVGEADLRRRLAESVARGRPLRVKLGMDPSTPDLHLGHTFALEKLRVFQELGHTPIFLIGDFTARIGDPSGRKKTRPPLSADEVGRNARTTSIKSEDLDVDRAEIGTTTSGWRRCPPSTSSASASLYACAASRA
jgi:tyrosyl-tRNA synthetase